MSDLKIVDNVSPLAYISLKAVYTLEYQGLIGNTYSMS